MEKKRTEIVAKILKRRVIPDGVYPSSDEVVRKLAGEQSLLLYGGYDPTGPHIHLGHSVGLLLLKALARDLGHSVVVLFGDFTARIGDPTEKETVRKMLSEEEITEHIKTWDQQIATLFGDVPYVIRRNSEWLDTMTFTDVIRLSASVTVQQMLARSMFQERIKKSQPIYLNEFLYPIAQGYDSVAMRVDGEIGGVDQTFNMLVGRDFEKEILGKDKLVLASPLIVDPRTGKKMSKSEGDLIAISDSPQEIRRKVLALDDTITKTLFELCTERDQDWIDKQQAAVDADQNPRQFKEELAAELIRMYHSESAVAEAAEAISIKGEGPLDKVLSEAGLAASVAEAKRLIDQGAVEINGSVVKEWKYEVKSGDELHVGKGKFVRIQ